MKRLFHAQTRSASSSTRPSACSIHTISRAVCSTYRSASVSGNLSSTTSATRKPSLEETRNDDTETHIPVVAIRRTEESLARSRDGVLLGPARLCQSGSPASHPLFPVGRRREQAGGTVLLSVCRFGHSRENAVGCLLFTIPAAILAQLL